MRSHAIQNTFAFVPQVPVEDLPSDARSRAATLVAQVQDVHAQKISTLVESRIDSELPLQAPWMSTEVRQQLRHAWMLANYYEVIAQVVSGASSSSSSSVQSSGSVAMFTSPAKKARRSVAPDQNAQVAFHNVQELHQLDLPQRAPLGLEAIVLHCPTEPRYVNVTNRSTGQKEPVALLTVLVADTTGPVAFEAWRDSADQLLRNCSEWGDQLQDAQQLYVELQRFDAREDTRAHQVPMRRLPSTEQTIVSRVFAPRRESLTNNAMSPHPGLYTKEFNRLVFQPPFIVNISGIVSMVQEEMLSSNGESMRLFRLSDAGGRFVQCRAFSRHAANVHVANGTEVILYFVNAQSGLHNQAGKLWISSCAL